MTVITESILILIKTARGLVIFQMCQNSFVENARECFSDCAKNADTSVIGRVTFVTCFEQVEKYPTPPVGRDPFEVLNGFE